MQLMSFSLYLRFGTNRLVCFFLSFFVYCCPYGLSTMPLPMPPPFLYRLKSRPKGSPLYFAANACFVIPFTFCTFTSNFTFRVRVFFFFFFQILFQCFWVSLPFVPPDILCAFEEQLYYIVTRRLLLRCVLNQHMGRRWGLTDSDDYALQMRALHAWFSLAPLRIEYCFWTPHPTPPFFFLVSLSSFYFSGDGLRFTGL